MKRLTLGEQLLHAELKTQTVPPGHLGGNLKEKEEKKGVALGKEKKLKEETKQDQATKKGAERGFQGNGPEVVTKGLLYGRVGKIVVKRKREKTLQWARKREKKKKVVQTGPGGVLDVVRSGWGGTKTRGSKIVCWAWERKKRRAPIFSTLKQSGGRKLVRL